MTRFNPDWVSSPGDTIADILHERGLTEADLAERTGMTQTSVAALVAGKALLTEDIARRLESALGASNGFWLAREANYRAGLARVTR